MADTPNIASGRFPGDIDRRVMMCLPLEERRGIMRAQADEIADEYNREIDEAWQVGDFVDEPER